MRLGLQLYTLRDLDETLVETIRRVGELPYEGVQLAGFGESAPTDVKSAIDTAGLELAGAHVSLDEFEDGEEALDRYRTAGAEEFIVPYYPSESFESLDGARDAAAELLEIADTHLEDDERLHYHNHSEEFTQFDDRTAFDAFAAAGSELGLEIDTGLANYAGVDPVALLEQYGDRVTYLHLTDSVQGEWETRHSDLGDGDIDIQTVLDTCREHGVDWIVFEHGLTDDPVRSVEQAAEYLDGML